LYGVAALNLQLQQQELLYRADCWKEMLGKKLADGVLYMHA
jgi:hypothetical protein